MSGQTLGLLRKSKHARQGFIDRLGRWESFLNIWLKDNHIATVRKMFEIFAAHANTQLVPFQLWNVLISLAHRCFFHNVPPFAR
ncbi:MAG: hypothetical protein JWM03_479 [Rhodocyclales bacterium]|nr:hypothetical protein [Rhodocyclales bacterium]